MSGGEFLAIPIVSALSLSVTEQACAARVQSAVTTHVSKLAYVFSVPQRAPSLSTRLAASKTCRSASKKGVTADLYDSTGICKSSGSAVEIALRTRIRRLLCRQRRTQAVSLVVAETMVSNAEKLFAPAYDR